MTQQTRKVFLVITFLVIFLFSSSLVVANSDFSGWGNTGQRYGSSNSQLHNLMFGSNFPEGNIDFTTITIAQTQDFYPMVFDLDADGENEVYTFNDNFVTEYDPVGNLVTEVVLLTDVCGPGIVVQTDEGNKMVVMTIKAGGYRIYTLDQTSLGLASEQTIEVTTTDTNTCIPVGGLTNRATSGLDVAYFVYENNSVLQFNATSNTAEIISSNPWDTITPGTAQTLLYELGGGITMARRTENGVGQIAWMNVNSSTKRVVYYIPEQDVYKETTLTISNAVNNNSCFVHSLGSSLSYFITCQQSSPSSAGHTLEIFDKDLNSKYSDSWNIANQDVIGTVCDVDNDGGNELCYSNNFKLQCVDASFTVEWEFNMTATLIADNYIACGEYSNLSDFKEIITDSGLFILNTTSGNMTEILDLGVDGTDGMFYPTTLPQSSEFKKDLLFASVDNLVYYIASGTPPVCGNGICESGENAQTCFVDCGVQDPDPTNSSQGSFGHNQECTADTDCFGTLRCQNFYCLGSITGQSCVNDFECQSGVCNDIGACTDATFEKKVGNFFFAAGFTSTGSLLFIALLIIFFGTLAGASTGAAFGGVIGAGVGGAMALIVSSLIVSLIFGWIGLWFLFMFIFIVIAVLLFTLASRGG